MKNITAAGNEVRPNRRKRIILQILSFLIVFLIFASLALVRDGRLFGVNFGDSATSQDTEAVADGEQRVVSTAVIGKDIIGYGGPVPLEIYITGNRIDSIHALPNSETPDFFGRLYTEGLMKRWNGLTTEEAVKLPVDAVSGATFSSEAVINNVRAGLSYDMKQTAGKAVKSASSEEVPVKLIFVAIVIAMGAIIPLFWHNKTYRIVQQLLNVGVLGFWGGTFLDYAVTIKVFANGLNWSFASIITLALLIIGYIYPLFGKYTYYCSNICPLGSLQDLAGHLCPKKLHIGRRTLRVLEIMRQVLWFVLLAGLWTGFWTSWVDNELFTAFIVESASWTMLGVGIAIVLLSIFIPRPFCRFVCPTGTILHHAQHA